MGRLGIDIGTTSIKCSFVEHDIIYHSKTVHDADITTNCDNKQEQSVSTLMSGVRTALTSIAQQLDVQEIPAEFVSSCCQMHGVVLWNTAGEVSNLVTWQDQRCDAEFLTGLPWELHTGYGCATLAWLAKHDRDVLAQYQYCGTIADYLVYLLCGEVGISDQNAQSWGMFNDREMCWDREYVEKTGIAISLPPIYRHGTRMGTVSSSLFPICLGATVNVPLGDLQASVFAVLRSSSSGRVFNYGTASQLVATLPADIRPALPQSVRRCVYTSALHLVTAASLNGGNALQLVHGLSPDTPYGKLMELAEEKRDTTLIVNPCFFGERHATSSLGSFSNISHDNFTLGDIAAATCRGVVRNLCDMMGDSGDLQKGQLYVCGIADRRVLQFYVRQVFGEFTLFEEEVTAAYGALLFDQDNQA